MSFRNAGNQASSVILPVFKIDNQQQSFQLYCHAMREQVLRFIQQLTVHEVCYIDGAVNRGFSLNATNPKLLMCDEAGFPAIICVAEALHKQQAKIALVICQFDHALPFKHQPSQYIVPNIPPHVTGAIPLLEDWRIASRIASSLDLPACFDGDAVELAEQWLSNQSPLFGMELLAAGSDAFLSRVSALDDAYFSGRQRSVVFT